MDYLRLFFTSILLLEVSLGLSWAEAKKATRAITEYHDVFQKSCHSFVDEPDTIAEISGWLLNSFDNGIMSYKNQTFDKEIKIKTIVRNSELRGIRYTFFEGFLAKLFISAGENCEINLARNINRDRNKKIISISTLNNELTEISTVEKVNPDVPPLEPPTGTKVALIDTGVNYLLPEINARLSRVSPKELLGYDFEDEDKLPFDMDFVGSPFFPRHHGTSVASLLIKEAPLAQVVPYRFSRSDPCKFKRLIEHIEKNNIKIVALPMGSRKRESWKCFYDSANEKQNILFITSAGNNGFDIDKQNIFPASFSLDNLLVVSSSTIFGTLARGSNYGISSVDFLIPGEQIEVVDHRGVRTVASGSSYAVPRLTAMVARFLTINPDASIRDIKEMLIARAVSVEPKSVKYGWIPDPLDDYLF